MFSESEQLERDRVVRDVGRRVPVHRLRPRLGHLELALVEREPGEFEPGQFGSLADPLALLDLRERGAGGAEVVAQEGDFAEVEPGAGGDGAVREAGEDLAQQGLGLPVVAEDVFLQAGELAERDGVVRVRRVLAEERLEALERAVVVGRRNPVAVGVEGALAGCAGRAARRAGPC